MSVTNITSKMEDKNEQMQTRNLIMFASIIQIHEDLVGYEVEINENTYQV